MGAAETPDTPKIAESAQAEMVTTRMGMSFLPVLAGVAGSLFSFEIMPD
jgi:hypothetical protein